MEKLTKIGQEKGKKREVKTSELDASQNDLHLTSRIRHKHKSWHS